MCDCCQSTQRVAEIIEQYKGKQGALIPVLHAVQKELGHLPQEVLQKIAKELGVPASQVYGTTTFYTLFSTKEKADNIIRVCESGPCHVSGYQEILDAIETELGIEAGQATADKKFYLEKCACLGVCAEAPAIMINEKTYVNLTPAKVKELLESY